LANFGWSLGGGKGPTRPGVVVGLDIDIALKDLLETRVFDFVEITKYVDLLHSLPVAMEKSRNTIHINIV
jgi:hypothetical protein